MGPRALGGVEIQAMGPRPAGRPTLHLPAAHRAGTVPVVLAPVCERRRTGQVLRQLCHDQVKDSVASRLLRSLRVQQRAMGQVRGGRVTRRATESISYVVSNCGRCCRRGAHDWHHAQVGGFLREKQAWDVRLSFCRDLIDFGITILFTCALVDERAYGSGCVPTHPPTVCRYGGKGGGTDSEPPGREMYPGPA
eukprot:3941664-Rhodomonas_salina.1